MADALGRPVTRLARRRRPRSAARRLPPWSEVATSRPKRRSARCSSHGRSGQRHIVRRGNDSSVSMRSSVAKTDIEQLSIDTIRTLSMDSVQQANAGHPGTAMALAPLAYLLYREVMHHNPANPHWPDRDRFILSAGHACILQYSDAPPRGLQPLARGAEALPAVGVADAGTSRGASHARRRGDDRDRSARDIANGVGFGHRRALPRRALQPAVRRDRRPPRLLHLLRRRPDGRRLERGRLDRRHARPRQAHLLLRRQPHHDRRHDVDLVHRGPRRSATRRWAGTCSTSTM